MKDQCTIVKLHFKSYRFMINLLFNRWIKAKELINQKAKHERMHNIEW